MKRRLLALTVLSSLTCTACGEYTARNDPPQDEPTWEEWSLGAEPDLSIGVVEGEEPYQLHTASSSRVLRDGRIAVVNGGSHEVRFFDGSGSYLGAFGREGGGPGEFRGARHLRQMPDGTLRVWDQRLRRFSVHSADGEYAGGEALEWTRREPFPGNVWLHRRNLVLSPVAPGSRGPIVAALDALPPVDTALTVRHVRVTEQGRFWTHEVGLPSDEPVEARVWSLEGSPVARVTLPARFEIHEVGTDYVLGRRFDELDVNHIERYELRKPAGSFPGPGLGNLRKVRDRPVPYARPTEVPREVWPTLRSTLKQMATRQEMHYASNMSYTTDLEAMEFELPDHVRVDFFNAGPTGWAGFVTHEPTDAYCLLAYGMTVPMGWQSGAVVCPGA